MADKKKKKSFNELVGMTANYQDLLSNISGPGKKRLLPPLLQNLLMK